MATPSFRQILERLDEHGVEYVVVGGVAAVLRGAPITTFDFDALVKIDPANAERLVNALRALDARYREHFPATLKGSEQHQQPQQEQSAVLTSAVLKIGQMAKKWR